jgi:multiple sugar transport system substrate-binding protein
MVLKRREARSGMARLLALFMVFALVLSACAGAASPAPASGSPASSQAAAPSPTEAPAITPEPIDPAAPGPNGGVVVRWFVGLGAGGQPQQLQAEAEFVNEYNNSQKDVYLALEIYNNNVAANILKTQIAAGNPPDIIGPVGVEGLNLFIDQLLDLQPLIDENNYSVEGVPQELVDFFKLGEGGTTIGVPFGVFPSFVYYNKDLFDEAGLPYPPTKVGDQYEGKDWDMDTLREVAMKLTVDANGNDATSADFDPANIVQWGYDMQFADSSPLAESSLFGASSFVAEDRKTAQIPDEVRTGEQWFNDGVWKDYFIPNAAQINSDLLDKGSPFGSGNIAMVSSHTWFTCCVYPAPPAEPKVKNFGFAIAPSYNGTITAKLHADTFSILKSTKVPDEAFQALTTLVGSEELLTLYGAMPANPAQQQGFIDSTNANFPGQTLDWSVPQAMLEHVDIPNHQAWVPNYAKAKPAWQAFHNSYRSTEGGIDIDAELDKLQVTLQGIFDEVQ